MRCLITLETRPCEEPINFKVLLLPIQLSIIQNIRLFASPSNEGPRVGTAEQGNDAAINSENVTETSVSEAVLGPNPKKRQEKLDKL